MDSTTPSGISQPGVQGWQTTGNGFFASSDPAADGSPQLPSDTQPAAFTDSGGGTLVAGTPGSLTITTTAAPTAGIWESGALPPGITFTDNGDGTAALAGTPATGSGGTYALTLTASNAIGFAATQSYVLTVNASPAITSDSPNAFVVNQPESFTITSSGGYPTPAISETGAVPAGVSFIDNGDGSALLSGTPASGSAGTYPITITASNGIAPDATQSFTLTVLPLGITTTSLLSGSVYSKTNKVLYSATLAASGGNLPYKWTLAPGSTPLHPA